MSGTPWPTAWNDASEPRRGSDLPRLGDLPNYSPAVANAHANATGRGLVATIRAAALRLVRREVEGNEAEVDRLRRMIAEVGE